MHLIIIIHFPLIQFLILAPVYDIPNLSNIIDSPHKIDNRGKIVKSPSTFKLIK
jgi:hypothetical protein